MDPVPMYWIGIALLAGFLLGVFFRFGIRMIEAQLLSDLQRENQQLRSLVREMLPGWEVLVEQLPDPVSPPYEDITRRANALLDRPDPAQQLMTVEEPNVGLVQL